MTEDEMKNRISMALKDPILQQGFEIICKSIDELEKENAELNKKKLSKAESEFNEYSKKPKKKINALCFDIKQNKFVLGFYDLDADEWVRYGGYETICIDLWKEIAPPKLPKEASE